MQTLSYTTTVHRSCCYWCLGFIFLVLPELFIQSICVTLSLCGLSQQKWENDVPFLFPHQQASLHAASGVFPASLHSLIQSSHNQWDTCLSPGMVSSLPMLQDDRQSQLHSKIRPIDLFQELHSNPERVRNLYCRLNFCFAATKIQMPSVHWL